MDWNTVQKTPLFFTILHTIMMLFTILFSTYLFAIIQTTREIQAIEKQKSELQQLINVFSTQKNYLQSETFAIRYLKEVEQRKLKGEQVINTSEWERTPDSSGTNYIPTLPRPDNSTQWTTCITDSLATCLDSP